MYASAPPGASQERGRGAGVPMGVLALPRRSGSSRRFPPPAVDNGAAERKPGRVRCVVSMRC